MLAKCQARKQLTSNVLARAESKALLTTQPRNINNSAMADCHAIVEQESLVQKLIPGGSCLHPLSPGTSRMANQILAPVHTCSKAKQIMHSMYG